MASLVVWSEQEAAGLNFRNCTYCAGLMVLVAGGKTDYPLGIHTEAEQRALRAADVSANPETFRGMTFAVKSRYVVDLHLVPDQSPAGITQLLGREGLAIAIAGKISNFPAGHTLRRWAPAFTGFHAVTVSPYGNGNLWWGDPMAPMGYEGQTVTLAQALQFIGTNYPLDARYLALDELTEDDMAGPGTKGTGAPIGTFTFDAQAHALINTSETTRHYQQPPNAGPFTVLAALDLKTNDLKHPSPPGGVPIDIEGHSPPQNNRDQVYLVDAPEFGCAAYALRSDGTFTPASDGYSQVELDAAVDKAEAEASQTAAQAVAAAATQEAAKFE